MLLVTILAAALAGACGGSASVPTTYRGIDLSPPEDVGTDLPAAWLVTGDAAHPGAVAAFSWRGMDADPAFALPNLAAVTLAENGRVSLVIHAPEVGSVGAGIRPWAPDGRIVPLLGGDRLDAELRPEDGLTVVTLAGLPGEGEQLLRLSVVYEDGDAVYVWRVRT